MTGHGRYGDPDRADVAHAVTMAAQAASAVGLPLGMWVGLGDWSAWSQDARDKAGVRALAELDAALDQLRTARDRLAAALGPADTPADTDGGRNG